MHEEARTSFLKYANRLVKEGQRLIDSGTPKRGKRKRIPRVTLNKCAYEKWRTSCRNLVYQLSRCASPWESYFHPSKDYSLDLAIRELGALEAIRDALANNNLVTLEMIATTNCIVMLAAQAQHLLDKGYHLAAGILSRAILETRLRALCEKHDCYPDRVRPTLSDFAGRLKGKRLIDPPTYHEIIKAAEIANHASHNIQPPLPNEVMEKLVYSITQLVIRYPL